MTSKTVRHDNSEKLTKVTDNAMRDGWILQGVHRELHKKWLALTDNWRGALRTFLWSRILQGQQQQVKSISDSM